MYTAVAPVREAPAATPTVAGTDRCVMCVSVCECMTARIYNITALCPCTLASLLYLS